MFPFAIRRRAAPPPSEGTPLQQYSALTLEEIATYWSGFEDIDPPSVSGAILESPWSTLHTVAAENPGRQVRCTTSAGTDAAGGLNACTDVEILVPDGVQLGVMYIEDSTRVRIRGEGPESRCDGIRARFGSSHITAHSLLIPGSGAGDSVAVLDADHVAFISCIIGGATNSNCGLLSDDTLTDVLFANCNFGSPDNGGVNDWVLRFGVLDRLVMVDCFCEARGLQPVLRRSAATKSLFLRVTTYNEFDNESFADVGTGDVDHILTDCYLRDCISYVSADGSFRFGGYNASATNKSVIWRVYDHTWHTPTGGADAAATLASLETGEETAGDWEYRLGTPTYVTDWDGAHPGWPTITSSFGFDMDSGGTDPNSPYDIP